ncbi:polysaccharide ABC transporter ATP-binding protein [Microbacterium marinilacus]|uniref:ABC transporter domain-containing protein n=1 Tax=Microbacterium marinilacus TaxID=415209 RepID=A0ABP7BLW3_9MICO|nr:polysaccharide ABC transporter ATP-binding protein [Microbacterium marinilacus]MBY0690058.1 ATP-binding cassette domain-containing protein [Microbacterium marinilacus]
MRDTAISVESLSKSYRIAQNGEQTNRITDAVLSRLRHPLTRLHYETFDALKDVSFDIPWGEAVGIVGRNGAGKSTLLKLLTRVAAPTRGVIDLGGRVGSLLEVGTGFHPELTGRENIFLNGSLLGMSRREIQRRFDEIVDFSGVERFLETPVKRYSSGMYVRLAFSVAAHLETEILAIDEVLAVGDAEFQRKSLAKMRDVARDGRTVLYVSHQVSTVTSLCTSAMFLDRGTLAYHGTVEGALARYQDTFESFQRDQLDAARRPGTGQVRFRSVTVSEPAVDPADDKVVEFSVSAGSGVVGKYFVSCHVNDANGVVVAQCDSRLSGAWFDPDREQSGALRIKNLWLKPGRYTIDMYVCQAGILDAWEGADAIDVRPSPPYPEVTNDEALSHGLVLADFAYERAS